MARRGAVVGVSDHNGWAVLMTVGDDGALLDRRRIEIIDADLPSMPHHHDAQGLPVDQAVALVQRVQASASRHATLALDALAASVRVPIRGVALRKCPALPPTIIERIQDYRAQCVADTVMYRMAIADEAESRGWFVAWYQAKTVLTTAQALVPDVDLDARFRELSRRLGPPWTNDHRLAMAGAIAAGCNSAARHAPVR